MSYEAIHRLTTRNNIPELLIELGLTNRICEIGVLRGRHFVNLMRCNPHLAVGIDMWHGVRRTSYYEALCAKYANDVRVKFIKRRCENAVRTFPDEYFDFVYQDAGHSYEAVSRDLEQWIPKVAIGGIIAGHDYTYRLARRSPLRQAKGVVDAVNLAVVKYGLKHFHVTEDRFPTWLAVKE